jgi:hypothetical protein
MIKVIEKLINDLEILKLKLKEEKNEEEKFHLELEIKAYRIAIKYLNDRLHDRRVRKLNDNEGKK